MTPHAERSKAEEVVIFNTQAEAEAFLMANSSSNEGLCCMKMSTKSLPDALYSGARDSSLSSHGLLCFFPFKKSPDLASRPFLRPLKQPLEFAYVPHFQAKQPSKNIWVLLPIFGQHKHAKMESNRSLTSDSCTSANILPPFPEAWSYVKHPPSNEKEVCHSLQKTEKRRSSLRKVQ